MFANDANTVLLLLTFLPMIIAAVFVVMSFYRAGYGPIGKLLSIGFLTLVASLIFGIMYSIERQAVYQTIAGATRAFGWSLIALGFIAWFRELDRSIP